RNMSAVKGALNRSVTYAKDRRQFGKAIAEFGLIKEKLAGMAVRAFVGDSMSYRTLGDVDRTVGGSHDGGLVMKTIEGFSCECSINKVWTSEALAWSVDQGVQVFGGNGYSREFPLERMYRDARITRIYEGTNEINRMLIPTRLLKGNPDQFSAAAVDRAIAGQASGAGPQAVADRAKRLAVALLGRASAVYGAELKEAQEVEAQIADIVMEAYAVESAHARAEKLAKRGRGAAMAADISQVYASEAAERIASASRSVSATLSGRAVDRPFALAVEQIAAPAPFDAISARRRIANAVIESGKYPL
ncbi:MAG TPA: acyl-CoA dehydrogenase family protein, partial [Vicinamibacterales bacterium]|nr:acyl-CoA dehydrogenase family protein [Vicinamibacterales bacterium]